MVVTLFPYHFVLLRKKLFSLNYLLVVTTAIDSGRFNEKCLFIKTILRPSQMSREVVAGAQGYGPCASSSSPATVWLTESE